MEVSMRTLATPSASDLRAALARHQLRIFLVGAQANIHPVRLGRLLSGKTPLPPGVAEKIAVAIEALATVQVEGQSRA
jgi:hypothetical protein